MKCPRPYCKGNLFYEFNEWGVELKCALCARTYLIGSIVNSGTGLFIDYSVCGSGSGTVLPATKGSKYS